MVSDSVERCWQDLERAIALVCSHARLRDDREDFAQEVRMHVLGKPQMLDAFRGRSNLETYLFRLVSNELLNWRAHEYGRWRPSARARRIGAVGVAFERLRDRDGLGPEAAIERLVSRGLGTPDDLRSLVAPIPATRRRPDQIQQNQMISPAGVAADGTIRTAPMVADPELETRAAKLATLVARAIQNLPHSDRALLCWRFHTGAAPVKIASLGMTERHAYSRVETVLRHLHKIAALAGFDAVDVAEMIDRRLLDCASIRSALRTRCATVKSTV